MSDPVEPLSYEWLPSFVVHSWNWGICGANTRYVGLHTLRKQAVPWGCDS